MLVGHLAVALAAKRIEPRVRLGAAVAAAFALDLLWPILLILGLESVEVHPGDTAFTNLAFVSYPWSHSLAAVLVWAAVAGMVAFHMTAQRRVAIVFGTLVASHWVLDFITHRPDLPLWPGGPLAGLGVWQSIPGTVLVEGGLLALATWLYISRFPTRGRTGRWALAGLLAVLGGIWVTQPWAPPPPSATAVAWGALVLWALLPWAAWIERHRGAAAPGT